MNDKDRDRIDKLIQKAESVTGQKHVTLDRIYHRRITKKTKNILNDKTHPLVGEFDSRQNVRSGRLRLPTIRTEKSCLPNVDNGFLQSRLGKSVCLMLILGNIFTLGKPILPNMNSSH